MKTSQSSVLPRIKVKSIAQQFSHKSPKDAYPTEQDRQSITRTQEDHGPAGWDSINTLGELGDLTQELNPQISQPSD